MSDGITRKRRVKVTYRKGRVKNRYNEWNGHGRVKMLKEKKSGRNSGEKSEWEEDPPYSSPIFLWALQMQERELQEFSITPFLLSFPSFCIPFFFHTLPLQVFSELLYSVCDIWRRFSLRIMLTCCRLCTPGLLNPFCTAHILLL